LEKARTQNLWRLLSAAALWQWLDMASAGAASQPLLLERKESRK